MYMRSSNRNHGASSRTRAAFIAALLIVPLAAHALSTDRQQKMIVDGGALKVVQNKNANQPSVSYLTGGAKIVQGSMKATGDAATIYQHPSSAKDAEGNDVGGGVERVILVGKSKPAHIEQKQDDGGFVTADSDKIDYNVDTSIAELAGNVVVKQTGRGEFRSQHMTYNTNTGEMQGGGESPESRVHMIIEPKAKPAAKPADNTPANPPAAKKDDTH